MYSVRRLRKLDSTPDRIQDPLVSRTRPSPSFRSPPFVATTTSSRRTTSHKASASNPSAVPNPYPCAVSNNVTPSSSARWMVAVASPLSTVPHSPPNDHVPNAIVDASRSVLPKRAYRIAITSSAYSRSRTVEQIPDQEPDACRAEADQHHLDPTPLPVTDERHRRVHTDTEQDECTEHERQHESRRLGKPHEWEQRDEMCDES